MSPRDRRRFASPMRVFLLASVATAVAAGVLAYGHMTADRGIRPEPLPVAQQSSRDDPIPAEALVFRTSAGMLAIEPSDSARRAAHPRSLATWRSLRAYPGAPPRVPHGLTPVEFRTGGCRTCHERGGFSQRFGAYVPVTPHPEMGACLQCHVGDAKLMAIDLPGTDPSARCRQCHAAGAMVWRDSSSQWLTSAWPRLAADAPDRAPPPIPHSLQMRGNCLSCHAAPSGVADIRTTHPERADCRSCHVAAGADEFSRRVRRVADRGRTP